MSQDSPEPAPKDEDSPSAMKYIRSETPASLSELERQPLHQAMIALGALMAIILAIPSFFISFGVLRAVGVGLGASVGLGFITLFFDLVLGFLLLYCYILGKRRPTASATGAVVLSLMLILLGGFAGILSGIISFCGGVIGLLRRSRIMPDSITKTAPIVDDIFLMYKDGRLIRHYTRRLKPSVDEDILSSMLVAVQDFVKDSFERSTGEDTPLDEMAFGQFKIVIGRGKHVIIAALVLGDGAERLRSQITRAVKDIETRHPHLLDNWDGVLDKLRPLNKEMKDLIDGEYDGKTHYSNA